MRKRILTLITSSLLSFKSFDAFSHDNELVNDTELFNHELKRGMAEEALLRMYNQIDLAADLKPAYKVFRKAMIGFLNLQKGYELDARNILTIVDFELPSSQKRMWIIDLNTSKVLFHELVAHGRNSGDLYATAFSNENNSNASSLGFYLTGEQYTGKYGLSLRLDGLEEGYNERARERAVVLHGADYASQAFVDAQGRLGRSYGCPAVPFENKDAIVEAIADKTVLFINGPDAEYEEKSFLLNQVTAIDYFAENGFLLAPPVG